MKNGALPQQKKSMIYACPPYRLANRVLELKANLFKSG
jgi:hypothetical protein